jgi:hypothetical protein
LDTPDEVLDGYWPDEKEHPLRQLRALCLTGRFAHVSVGEPFRFANEWIRLDEKRSTTYERWQSARFRGEIFHLFCSDCGRVTVHAPKGAIDIE